MRRGWFGPRHAILLSAVWVSATAACAFDPPPIEAQDAGLEADAAGEPDAWVEPPDAGFKDANDFDRDAWVADAEEPRLPVPFLPEGQPSPGEGDLALQGDLLVDTSTSVGFPERPQGVVFEIVGSSTLARAVLRVRNLEIPAGTTLRVQGSHPLIVVAETILIEGLLDASANGPVAGPGGGSALDPGPGAGGPGRSGMGRSDSGGGGAGGAVPGAAGGAASDGGVLGGAPGEAYLAGDLESRPNLLGGSAGGQGGPGDCPMGGPLGGAGGGAVVLYAAQSLVITSSGAVDVSGGGAQIARDCGGNGAAGAGGGSGGVAFLVARSLTMTGTIAANGGAGGGGSGEGTGPGNAGQDGLLGLDAARGGARRDARGQKGGDGATRSPPEPGGADLSIMNSTRGNGGGGGGASGRIHLRYRRLFEVEGSTSPTFTYERK